MEAQAEITFHGGSIPQNEGDVREVPKEQYEMLLCGFQRILDQVGTRHRITYIINRAIEFYLRCEYISAHQSILLVLASTVLYTNHFTLNSVPITHPVLQKYL